MALLRLVLPVLEDCSLGVSWGQQYMRLEPSLLYSLVANGFEISSFIFPFCKREFFCSAGYEPRSCT